MYIKEGKFRQDLFFRLNVLNLKIPALRERKEDIPLLIEHFIQIANKKMNKNIEGVSDKAMREYTEYSWPGNVRELKNVINRAVLLNSGRVIEKSYLNFYENSLKNNDDLEITEGFSLDEKVKELEIKYIKKALEMAEGSQSKAAKLLGITRDMLRYRIKNYNITFEK
jgi:DNA-binding NtrC family response regulator